MQMQWRKRLVMKLGSFVRCRTLVADKEKLKLLIFIIKLVLFSHQIHLHLSNKLRLTYIYCFLVMRITCSLIVGFNLYDYIIEFFQNLQLK